MKKRQEQKRTKLLVAIINKEDHDAYTASVNSLCTALHFSGIGHGTARSSYMSYFGINDIEKRVVFSIIPERTSVIEKKFAKSDRNGGKK